METKDDGGQVNPASGEVLWIEEKLRRYRTAGVGMFLWAVFVAEVMAGGRYDSTYLFFTLSGYTILLTVVGLAVKRSSKACLLATFGVHLGLWVACNAVNSSEIVRDANEGKQRE